MGENVIFVNIRLSTREKWKLLSNLHKFILHKSQGRPITVRYRNKHLLQHILLGSDCAKLITFMMLKLHISLIRD